MADRKFHGFLVRKERWGLSWRGRLLVAAGILLAGWVLVLEVHPFLAVNRPVPANVLVVEGWTHGFGLHAAVEEFDSGHYDRILTTGGPLEGMGTSTLIYNTYAYQTAELLRQAGVPAPEVQAVPCAFVGKDRTYNSALALGRWLQQNQPAVHSLNVLTEDAHARRTWMLFQKALAPRVRVGIISVPNPDYDAKHWWRSSDGVREVIDESVAYIYAEFFFWPPKPEPAGKP
jgi:DUF218 domain